MSTYELTNKVASTLLTKNARVFRSGAEFELATTATQFVQLVTGNVDTYCYGAVVNSSATAMEYSLIENPTVTDGTTPLTFTAFNRLREDVPKFTAYSDPTAVSGGITIKEHRSYVVHGSHQPIEIELNGHPLVLKRNTNYVFRLKNNDNNTRKFFVEFVLMEIP
jgi:hypothetical protein